MHQQPQQQQQQQQQQIYWYSHIQMILAKITIYEITAITNMQYAKLH